MKNSKIFSLAAMLAIVLSLSSSAMCMPDQNPTFNESTTTNSALNYNWLGLFGLLGLAGLIKRDKNDDRYEKDTQTIATRAERYTRGVRGRRYVVETSGKTWFLL